MGIDTGNRGGGKWTMPFNPGRESRFRLVCFPHAGGSAGSFLSLAAAAPPGLEVVGVQYPGRQWRRAEPSATDLHALARGAADALAADPGLPTAVLGHSMGALVAFETVRLLEAERPGSVDRLFVSGSRAPSRPREAAGKRQWTDAELIAELRRLGGTDDRLLSDAPALAAAVAALRADYRVLADYRPAPGARAELPVTVLMGSADPTAGPEHAADWRQFSGGAFDVRVFPGGHFFLAENAAGLIRLVLDGLVVPKLS
ncbi:alpha/beta fold hydrolase [Kitasatospora sp. NPDC097643]|uniref:thioesterase II family protein n=1 Tax=Kitasatospora sp. NPDC097643 TaxID=3157230 RepID=UPI00331AA5DC